MPTQITTATHQDSLSGSPEKRIDVTPDGALWLAVADAGKVRFFSSDDGGSTWEVSAGSDLSYGSGASTGVPSLFIDADGYAHLSVVRWQSSPQTILYARGTPKSGGGWTWTTQTISPASGRLGVDSDVIAFRTGAGWTAWVAWSLTTGARVSKLTINASGVITLASVMHGPASGDAAYQQGSLEFDHTGDGKTPTSTPHIYLATASQTSSSPVYGHRALYDSGSWSWESPTSITTGVTVPDTVLCSVFDGSRLLAAWATGGTAVSASEWSGTGAATARTPPAMPAGLGNIMGVSLAVDPSTLDIYLVAYGDTVGDVYYNVLTGTTWGSWTKVVDRTANTQDGDVQLVRHPGTDAVDLIYGEGNSPSIVLWHARVVGLTRTPGVPVLTSPTPGAQVDLALGSTFRWEYVPAGPGDTQQAWAFRRQYSSTTEYWNDGTQSWSGTEVWNTGAAALVSFPASQWTTGTTYSWSVATRSSASEDSAYAANRTVIATTAPVVALTAPAGIVFGTTTPLVSWTYTSAKAQLDYEVRVVDPAVAADETGPFVWESGIVASSVARSARITTALPDPSGTYRVYLRVHDSDTVASTWVSTTFSLSTLPPEGPSLTAVEQVPYWTGVPRARLTVTGRSNYLATDQATSDTGWSVNANCTIAPVSEDLLAQTYAGFSMTSVAAGDMSAITDLGSPPEVPPGQTMLTSPLDFPVVDTVDYTATVEVQAEGASARAVRVLIDWHGEDDGTPDLISTSIGQQVVADNTGYVQAHVTDTAPVGAKLARMIVEVLSTAAAGEIFDVARMSFAPGFSLQWRPGGSADLQTTRIERSDDGGDVWTQVQASAKTDYWQRVTLEDRTCPVGIDVLYRAYVDAASDTSGAIQSSEASPAAAVVLRHDQAWILRDPDDDTAEVSAYVTDYSSTDGSGSTTTYVAGRPYAIVDTEGLRHGDSTLTIFVQREYLDSMIDLVQRTGTLVAQSPSGLVVWGHSAQRDHVAEWRVDRRITLRLVVAEPQPRAELI